MGRVDGGPGFHHGEDLSGGHVGEGDVVMVGEGEDVTFSGDGGGAEEERGEVCLPWIRPDSLEA